MSSYFTIQAAIYAALELNESGVGVALPDDPAADQGTFVQWVSTESGDGTFAGLDRVEVCFPRTRDDIARELDARGFAPDPELEDIGIWFAEGTWEVPITTVEDLVAYIDGLLQLVGASEGVELTVYP